MSKIKTKKRWHRSRRKNFPSAITSSIVAVILVAASVATYGMQPQKQSAGREWSVQRRGRLKAQAKKIRGFKCRGFWQPAKPVVPGHAGDHEQRAHGRGARRGSRKTGEILSPLKQCRMRRSYREVRISQPFTWPQKYENIEVHYTPAFNEDMKLASFGTNKAGSFLRKHIGKINILKISVIVSWNRNLCAGFWRERRFYRTFPRSLIAAIYSWGGIYKTLFHCENCFTLVKGFFYGDHRAVFQCD